MYRKVANRLCSLEGMMLKGWNSSTLATSCEELTHWKRLWCWEGLRAGEKGDDRGWDGWMASLTRWTWVWVNSGSWWWTGRPGCCDSWGHKESDTTERLNWTELNWAVFPVLYSRPLFIYFKYNIHVNTYHTCQYMSYMSIPNLLSSF